MESSDDPHTITVQLTAIFPAGTSNAETDRFGLQLHQRIRELKVDSITSSAAPVLPGSKVADPITFTSLAVTLLPVLLPKLIDTVRDLLKSRKAHQVQFRVGDVSITLPQNPTPEDVANAIAVLSAATKPSDEKHG